MIEIPDVSRLVFAAANTHLYVIRRLREDPGFRKWAGTLSTDELRQAVADADGAASPNFERQANLYALLVAAFLAGDREALRIGSSMKSFSWASDISNDLLKMLPSMTMAEFRAEPTISFGEHETTRPASIRQDFQL